MDSKKLIERMDHTRVDRVREDIKVEPRQPWDGMSPARTEGEDGSFMVALQHGVYWLVNKKSWKALPITHNASDLMLGSLTGPEVVKRAKSLVGKIPESRTKINERMDRCQVDLLKEVGICYGLTKFRNHSQEWWETGQPGVRERASQLRRLGYKVSSSPQGVQVTPVGIVKMTLMNVSWEPNMEPPPDPERVERM